MAPYNSPRGTERVLNANDACVTVEPGMLSIVERAGRLLGLITLSVQI